MHLILAFVLLCVLTRLMSWTEIGMAYGAAVAIVSDWFGIASLGGWLFDSMMRDFRA